MPEYVLRGVKLSEVRQPEDRRVVNRRSVIQVSTTLSSAEGEAWRNLCRDNNKSSYQLLRELITKQLEMEKKEE